MKRLTLIRHAKSSWDDPDLDDFDRPLNRRGKRDAPRVGRALKARQFAPDGMVSSPALRAITTARIIASALGFPESAVREEPGIYDASVDTLRSVVKRLPPDKDHVILFGHNPGFELLAASLSGEGVRRMPTCAVCDLRFNVDRWTELSPGEGELLFFLSPKTLDE